MPKIISDLEGTLSPTFRVKTVRLKDESGTLAARNKADTDYVGFKVKAIEVTGGIKLGAAASAAAGTIQWNGSNFQGHDGSGWKNLDKQGTVTSVQLNVPSGILAVSSSPVTSAGTLDLYWIHQSANRVLAGPTSGSPYYPSFRLLVAADIPNLDWSKITSGKPTTLAGYGITNAVAIGSSLSSAALTMSTARLLGRSTAGTGVIEQITIGAGLSLSGGVLSTTGGGSVVSVGLALPAEFTVSGSPITGAGTLTGAWASQGANSVLAAPNGSAGTPSFRTLVAADIPNLDWSKITSGKPTTLAGYGITNGATNGLITGSGLTLVTNRLLGRSTAGTGAVEEISIGSGLSLSGGVLSNTAVGTVSSVGLALPSEFAISGSPVTSSGTLTATWNAQVKNTFLAGPTLGVNATPTFRTLQQADLPAGTVTGSGSGISAVAVWASTSSITGNSNFSYNIGTFQMSLSGGGDSTSTTTGTLKVSGGVGITQSVFVGGTLNVTRGTITTALSSFNNTVNWNAGAVTFTNILSNVTDTASAAGSLLMDLQKGGVSQFKVGKSGDVTQVGALNINRGTLTALSPSINVTATWNNAAVTFTSLLYNITDTASNAASLLMDLQKGGVSQFKVGKSGDVYIAGKLTVVGLIDPTGLQLSRQSSNPGTVDTYWVDNTGAPRFGSSTLSTGASGVTSVGLSLPAEFAVSGSPVTGSGTLTGAWASQAANSVLAAPNGSAGTPSFRILVAADIPALAYDATGTASGLMSSHTSALDPHPQYLTQTEGDALYVSLTGAYTDPSWITSLAYSKLTGAPTTWAWSSITSTPTTLSGYGITDAVAQGAVTASGLTMSTNRILGRTSALTGAIEEITVGSGLSLSGGILSSTAVTSPAGSNTQIQYNNSGSFGASSLFTFDSNPTTGGLIIGNTTQSTSSTTGSLRVSGGVGATGNIYAGGDISASHGSTASEAFGSGAYINNTTNTYGVVVLGNGAGFADGPSDFSFSSIVIGAGASGQNSQRTVLIGRNAYGYNGSDGVSIGASSGLEFASESVAIGRNAYVYGGNTNVIVGANTYIDSGSDNILIGYQAETSTGVSNAVVLGTRTVMTLSNALQIGRNHATLNNITRVRFNDGSQTITWDNPYNYVKFSTVPTPPTDVEGLVYWNDQDHTLNIVSDVTGAVLQVGQELWGRGVNKTGATLTNGTVVYYNGAQGNRPTFGKPAANNDNAEHTLAILTSDVSDNAEGFGTVHGVVRGINTSGWTAGDMLWLDTTAGVITNVAPAKPNRQVRVGYALNSTNNGSIYADVHAVPKISDLSDVTISGTASGDLLRWNGTLWVNSTLAAVFGTQAANTVYAGPTTGGAATPTFRALVAADIPALGYDLTGTAAGLLSSHTSALDPHPQYLTQAEGDALYVSLTGGYADPSWVTSLAYSKLTGAPTTWAWSSITSTPTTLSGYGITDGLTAATAASTYLPLAGGTLTGQLNFVRGTLTASSPSINTSSTWNNAGVTFVHTLYSVTDTASAAGSLLMDMQVGGVSQFTIGKGGALTVRGAITTLSTTTSTSTTTGSGVFYGGVGIAGDLFIGGKLGGLVEYCDAYIEAPTNKTYPIRSKANVTCTLTQIRGIKTSSGTCTVALQINGVNVTGASAVAVTSAAQDVTLTAANNVAAGDRITVVVTSASGAVDLEFTLASTRT